MEKFTTYHRVCSKINTTVFSGVRVNLFFLQVYKSNIIHCYNMLLGRGREGVVVVVVVVAGCKGHRGRLCMIYIYLRNNLDMIFKNKLW